MQARELQAMSSTETTENPGAKNYTRIAAVLMIILLGYGALALLGVIR
jgi:hypothetical protein